MPLPRHNNAETCGIDPAFFLEKFANTLSPSAIFVDKTNVISSVITLTRTFFSELSRSKETLRSCSACSGAALRSIDPL